jgi:hypothetical protein
VRSFVPGKELARAFYEESVASLVDGVPHAAALLGTGSDVLGFDTERSTDHGWGPRLQLFVAREDVDRVAEIIEAGLPEQFRGWPTRYGWDDVPLSHHVRVSVLEDFLTETLGFDPRVRVGVVDWLATPQQVLLEVTRGAVFHDPAGELRAVRAALGWYPDDVWLWLLGCQWRRLDQEEPFVGRTAEVGDEIGSRVIAARLARDLTRLCFLLERRYAPYSKWLGSAFRALDSYKDVAPHLLDALAATKYDRREAGLVAAFVAVAELHNALAPTAQVSTDVGLFHGRPFRVLGSGRFLDACLERVRDPRLRALPLVGSIDQLADSTDLLTSPAAFASGRAFYSAYELSA